MASVIIVILNYNGRHFLEKFLPYVILHSAGYEIVVADNNSSDDSIDFLSKNFPEINCLSFTENYGFCGGYNKALEQLNADYFVLLNSDIEVTPNWIQPIVALFEQDEKIAAVQPKLLDYNHKNKFEYAGGAGGFVDKFGYPFCKGRIFDTIETDHGQYDRNEEIFWASGACLFIRADLFKKYNGFDEDFFAHMEEIDLCWRMKLDGYKVFYCSDSVIYHVGGGTLAYANPRKTYLNFRNSIMVLIKNLPLRALMWKLPFRWVMDYIAVGKFVLTGNLKDALMVIKAHLYIWRNFYKTFKKRQPSLQGKQNNLGIYPKSLLFSYHIANKKKFTELRF